MNILDDTICAIATPFGEGGISIIRISGKEAFNIVNKIFKFKKQGLNDLNFCDAFTIHLGSIVNPENSILDEVLVSIFKKPKSYTGEDVIEINCHGGRIITKRILELLILSGARLAEPGEFTKRAFLNGRIDLSQAEAIADLISAKSDIAVKYSLNLLSGKYGNILRGYQKDLIDICGLIELELDFIEDDIQFADRNSIQNKIENLISEIRKMIKSYDIGKLFKYGIKVAIVGKPNVGKSTILNSLLDSERAIVSNIPGTTRDFIEENFYEQGFLFRLTDTAGLRVSTEQIENIGIEKTKEQINLSDIIIYIFDISQNYTEDDWMSFNEVLRSIESREEFVKIIIVFNKCDIIQEESIKDFILLNNKDIKSKKDDFLYISAKKTEDIKLLRNKLVQIVKTSNIDIDDNHLVTNFRHRKALEKAMENLERSLDSVNRNESGEFISVHLRSALSAIGEIIGTTTNEDILSNIFSKFCIGK